LEGAEIVIPKLEIQLLGRVPAKTFLEKDEPQNRLNVRFAHNARSSNVSWLCATRVSLSEPTFAVLIWQLFLQSFIG
jgi:hypothetical protein